MLLLPIEREQFLHLLPKNDFLLIEEEMKKLKFGKDHKPSNIIPMQSAPRRRKKRGPARADAGSEQAGARQ